MLALEAQAAPSGGVSGAAGVGPGLELVPVHAPGAVHTGQVRARARRRPGHAVTAVPRQEGHRVHQQQRHRTDLDAGVFQLPVVVGDLHLITNLTVDDEAQAVQARAHPQLLGDPLTAQPVEARLEGAVLPVGVPGRSVHVHHDAVTRQIDHEVGIRTHRREEQAFGLLVLPRVQHSAKLPGAREVQRPSGRHKGAVDLGPVGVAEQLQGRNLDAQLEGLLHAIRRPGGGQQYDLAAGTDGHGQIGEIDTDTVPGHHPHRLFAGGVVDLLPVAVVAGDDPLEGQVGIVGGGQVDPGAQIVGGDGGIILGPARGHHRGEGQRQLEAPPLDHLVVLAGAGPHQPALGLELQVGDPGDGELAVSIGQGAAELIRVVGEVAALHDSDRELDNLPSVITVLVGTDELGVVGQVEGLSGLHPSQPHQGAGDQLLTGRLRGHGHEEAIAQLAVVQAATSGTAGDHRPQSSFRGHQLDGLTRDRHLTAAVDLSGGIEHIVLEGPGAPVGVDVNVDDLLGEVTTLRVQPHQILGLGVAEAGNVGGAVIVHALEPASGQSQEEKDGTGIA